MGSEKDRELLVEQAHQFLKQVGHPRRVMGVIVVMTLATGYLASVALLHLGVNWMAVRYPLAVAIAYGIYLGMLGVWLRSQATRQNTVANDPEGLFVPGVAALGFASLKDMPEQEVGPSNRGSMIPDDVVEVGNIGDVVEGLGAVVILALIGLVCTLAVSIYLVAFSPMLLAELLVDGVLLTAMAKPMHRGPRPHWLRTAWRQTAGVAFLTAILFSLVGLEIQHIAPRARTLGEAWSIDQARKQRWRDDLGSKLTPGQSQAHQVVAGCASYCST